MKRIQKSHKPPQKHFVLLGDKGERENAFVQWYYGVCDS